MTATLTNILDGVDPDELVDILGLSIEDLVDAFEAEILENIDKFHHLDRGD